MAVSLGGGSRAKFRFCIFALRRAAAYGTAVLGTDPQSTVHSVPAVGRA